MKPAYLLHSLIVTLSQNDTRGHARHVYVHQNEIRYFPKCCLAKYLRGGKPRFFLVIPGFFLVLASSRIFWRKAVEFMNCWEVAGGSDPF
mmetsp:Transcript_29953/g.87480  ORF Transcript_29953/g.87480 Transcript_29953/m.87480 type:complete len:90 (-) Transcript_29953:973-1242(-)